METILQLNRHELHEEIKSCIRELLTELKDVQAIPPPDRIALDETCMVTGLSKASIYSMTHNKKIPFMKFGSRLVFSRKELILWMEAMTKPKKLLADEVTERLRKSALKKLKKGNY